MSAAFASNDRGNLGLHGVGGLYDNFLFSKHEKKESLADHIKYENKSYKRKGRINIAC